MIKEGALDNIQGILGLHRNYWFETWSDACWFWQVFGHHSWERWTCCISTFGHRSDSCCLLDHHFPPTHCISRNKPSRVQGMCNYKHHLLLSFLNRRPRKQLAKSEISLTVGLIISVKYRNNVFVYLLNNNYMSKQCIRFDNL